MLGLTTKLLGLTTELLGLTAKLLGLTTKLLWLTTELLGLTTKLLWLTVELPGLRVGNSAVVHWLTLPQRCAAISAERVAVCIVGSAFGTKHIFSSV